MLNRHSAPHSHRCCFFRFPTLSPYPPQPNNFSLYMSVFSNLWLSEKCNLKCSPTALERGGLYNRTRIYHIVCSNNHTFIRLLQCAFNLVLLQREFEILKWTTLKFSMGFWVNRFHMIDPIQLEFYFVSSININECILLIRFLIVHGPSAHGPHTEKGKKIILSLI